MEPYSLLKQQVTLLPEQVSDQVQPLRILETLQDIIGPDDQPVMFQCSTSLNVPYLTTFDGSVTISPSTRQVSDGDAITTLQLQIRQKQHSFGNSVYRLVTSSISP